MQPSTKLTDIMATDLGVIPATTKVRMVLELPFIRQLGVALIVNDTGIFKGAVRERELMQAVLANKYEIPVSNIMATINDVLSVQDTPQDAYQLMLKSSLRFAVVADQGKPVGIIWMDAALRYLEAEYSQKISDLQKTQEMMKRHDEMLANIIHDLRSPLATIKSCSDLIKQSPVQIGAANLELLSSLERNAVRGLSLASHLLKFCSESSSNGLTLEHFNVHEMLELHCQDLRIVANQKFKIDLNWSWCGDVSAYTDPTYLVQIIDNFLINAFKFSPAGSKVQLETSLVDSPVHKKKSLKIQITDQGPGIPKDKIPDIFGKYVQLSKPTPEISHPDGVGLGLAIAANYARLLNANIIVDGGGGESGHGAVFTLILPNVDVKKVVAPPKLKSTLKKILLVDDDTDILDILKDILRGDQFEIRTATDGLNGIAIFSSWSPDIVISDFKLPHKTGVELLHDVKSVNPNIPVVLISGALDQFARGDVEASFQADAYLEKPFQSSELLAMVHHFLARPPQQPAAETGL